MAWEHDVPEINILHYGNGKLGASIKVNEDRHLDMFPISLEVETEGSVIVKKALLNTLHAYLMAWIQQCAPLFISLKEHKASKPFLAAMIMAWNVVSLARQKDSPFLHVVSTTRTLSSVLFLANVVLFCFLHRRLRRLTFSWYWPEDCPGGPTCHDNLHHKRAIYNLS